MTLSKRRIRFTRDVQSLLDFINSGSLVDAALAECKRTEYQQEKYLADGLSTTMSSKHLEGLAVDLDFYLNGKYLLGIGLSRDEIKQTLQPIGDYWCSLTKGNVWGGNWETPFDVPHFQGP